MIPRDTTSERKDFFILAGLLLVLAAVIALDPLRLTGDVAVYLQGAKSVLRGERLFIDFYSDPLPIVFFLPSVWFSELAQLNMVLTLNGFLWLLTAGEVATLYVLLRRSAQRRLALLLPIVSIVSAYLVWAVNGFGQREHLSVLLWFPFLILRWLRWERQDAHVWWGLAVSIGAWAAVGSSMKPHFLLIAFLPELYLLITHRRWQTIFTPEAFAYVLTGFVYPLGLLLMPQEMRTALFDDFIPRIAENYNLVYTDAPTFIYYIVIGFIPMLWMCVLPFLSAKNTHNLLRPIAAAVVGAAIVTAVQNKGWYYQFIPAAHLTLYLMALLAFGGYSIFESKARHQRRLVLYGVAVPLLMMTLQLLFPLIGLASQYKSLNQARDDIRAIFDTFQPKQALVISPTGMPILALVTQANLPIVGRYIIDFPIIYTYGRDEYQNLPDIRVLYQPNAPQSTEIQRYLPELEADILRYQPDAIVIDNRVGCDLCPPEFQVTAWLEGIGFTSRVLANYERVSQDYGHDFYRRVTPTEAAP